MNADSGARQASPLLELLRKRLRKFMGLLPKVLNQEDPEAIHDLRVWSRRLQQVLVTLFPTPRAEEAQEIVRALRRARRAVGGWRDGDVLAELLERRRRRVRNPDERRAWESVLASVLKRRSREIRRARRRLAHRKLFTLAQDIGKLIEPVARDHRQDYSQRLQDSAGALSAAIRSAHQRWQDALVRALESGEPADAHAFRIQTKRLRYRIELARDLGASEADTALKWLKSLQDGLGRLHDRSETALMAAKALASPQWLIREPRASSLLLRRLAREQELRRDQTATILRAASAESSQVEGWVERYCGRPDGQPALARDIQQEPPRL